MQGSVGNMDGMLRHLVLPFLEDELSDVRCEAAAACARFIAMSESSVTAQLRDEVAKTRSTYRLTPCR